MSLIRVGLAETKDFAEGYDAIFGKKKPAEPADVKAKEKTEPPPVPEVPEPPAHPFRKGQGIGC